MSPSSKSRRRRPRKKRNNSKKILLIVASIVVVVIVIVGYSMMENNGSNGDLPNNNLTNKTKVLLETSMGSITIELRDDMPITTANFINLTQSGVYDNTIFHRVIADFVVQGGDPTGTGYGDPSIPNIPDEFSQTPENNENRRGTVAMANTGQPNSGSSQFFVNVVYNSGLDNLHPVFGEVVEGMAVVDEISQVATDPDGLPLEDVEIIRATVID